MILDYLESAHISSLGHNFGLQVSRSALVQHNRGSASFRLYPIFNMANNPPNEPLFDMREERM